MSTRTAPGNHPGPLKPAAKARLKKLGNDSGESGTKGTNARQPSARMTASAKVKAAGGPPKGDRKVGNPKLPQSVQGHGEFESMLSKHTTQANIRNGYTDSRYWSSPVFVDW
jgi:hypothetical protein